MGIQRPLLHQRGANSAHISAGLRSLAYTICELNMPITVRFLVADPHVATEVSSSNFGLVPAFWHQHWSFNSKNEWDQF